MTILDDYLLRHTVEELRALVELPRPAVKAAPPQIELLEDPPLTITRPLILMNGKAVAAIWPYVRVTVTETVDKDGSIKRHSPPVTKTEQRLMVVRGDGAIFGDGKRDLSEVGADVRLSEVPEQDRLWSVRGVNQFLRGVRSEPKNVFERIVAIVDALLDFARSLADQRTMCEMVGCYILATWFLDAFNVIGYIWPNGEAGSGKTKLILLVSRLAYLGEFILASGSLPTLRDMADYFRRFRHFFRHSLSTSQITDKAAEIAKDEELDIDPENINTKRVGWILTRLRLEKVGREEGKKGRLRLIKMADVERWRTAYSLFQEKRRGRSKTKLRKLRKLRNGGTRAGRGGFLMLANDIISTFKVRGIAVSLNGAGGLSVTPASMLTDDEAFRPSAH